MKCSEAIMRKLIFNLFAASVVSLFLVGATASAQTEYRFKVKHDHVRKYCLGELVINDSGVEYVTENTDHARKWEYVDIKLLKLVSPTKLKVLSYENGRFKVNDRDFRFELAEGELTKEVSDFVLTKVKRPVSTTFVPAGDEAPVFSIPVRHRRRFGGDSGTLKVYAASVVYESEGEQENSRYWRWSDIQGIGRSGQFKFSLTTYEPEFGGPTKTFDFDLKEPMDDRLYDYMWDRVYKVSYRLPPAGARPRPGVEQKKEKPAEQKEAAGEVTVVGYVSDSACGLKHMEGMGETECVLACAKEGKFVLADRENKIVYELDEGAREKVEKFAGRKVRVSGHLMGKSIHVMKVEPAS
jgi:hypothetical protein